MEGWMDGRMEGEAGLRIAYSNQKLLEFNQKQMNYIKKEFKIGQI